MSVNIHELFYELGGAIATELSISNTGRLYYWLSSLSWTRSFVVIHIIALIKAILSPLSLEGLPLRIFYIVQLELTLIQIITQKKFSFMFQNHMVGRLAPLQKI